MMDESLLRVTACSLVGLLVLAAVIMAWLWREQKKLKQDIKTISAGLQRNADDVAGLCSAAVAVDKRLAACEARISDAMGDITVPQAQSSPSYDKEPDEEQAQGYEYVIEKIRQGASVEDLVKYCGLTRDAAMLLMRLHGKH